MKRHKLTVYMGGGHGDLASVAFCNAEFWITWGPGYKAGDVVYVRPVGRATPPSKLKVYTNDTDKDPVGAAVNVT